MPGTAHSVFANILMGEKTAAELSPRARNALGLSGGLTAEDLDRLDSSAVRMSDVTGDAPRERSVTAERPPQAQPEAEPEPEPAEPIAAAPEPQPEPEPIQQVAPPPAEWTDEPAEEIAAETATRSELGKIFTAPNVSPLVYRETLADKYKGAWLSWEPETLWWSIRRDFGPISDLVRNKIMALRTCLKTNTPWIDWDAFENVGNAFNDEIPIFGELQPLEPEDVAYTVQTMRELGDWEFGAEVQGYMSAVCINAGLIYAPDDLFPGAQYFIDRHNAAPELVGTVHGLWKKTSSVDPDALTGVEWHEDNSAENQVKHLWLITSYLKHRNQQMSLAS